MDSNRSSPDIKDVLMQFGIDASAVSIIPVQQGLINHTWKIVDGAASYILQKVNDAVFKKPEDIAHNIASIAGYLAEHYPGYTFTAALKTTGGETIYKNPEGNYYRLFSFIEGSHTRNSVETAAQAYEAARQFGKFTATLKNFDAGILKTTIPSFHDIMLRYRQFLDALENGNKTRIDQSSQLISRLKEYSSIADYFENIKTDPAFTLRVTHHDTKISNVLFDRDDKGICVIDLDTVMPGYFISDVGDMMRTYLCEATEEEQDSSRLKIREEIYDAIVNGYLQEMGDELSEKEKQHFLNGRTGY